MKTHKNTLYKFLIDAGLDKDGKPVGFDFEGFIRKGELMPDNTQIIEIQVSGETKIIIGKDEKVFNKNTK